MLAYPLLCYARGMRCPVLSNAVPVPGRGKGRTAEVEEETDSQVGGEIKCKHAHSRTVCSGKVDVLN